jgi:hypothetical protein
MRETSDATREAAEDIFFGQLVLILARWVLILTAAAHMLWGASDQAALVVGMMPLVAMMALNFYVHGRYLMERPVNPTFLMTASIVDMGFVTLVIVLAPGPRGFESPVFVLYYPLLLAAAFVYPRWFTCAYLLGGMATYVAACLATSAPFLGDSRQLEVLVQRLTVGVAMAGLGTYYWRIQRRRRAVLAGAGSGPCVPGKEDES